MKGTLARFMATSLLWKASQSIASGQVVPADPMRKSEWSPQECARSFGLELLSPVPGGIPVRVMDAASGKPVADAAVLVVDEAAFGRHWGSIEEDERDTRRQVRDLGRIYGTAADGRTSIAPELHCNAVIALRGDHSGRTRLDVFDRRERVVVLSSRDLAVEVVDAAGKPKPGVPVALGQRSEDMRPPGASRGALEIETRDDVDRPVMTRARLDLSLGRGHQ